MSRRGVFVGAYIPEELKHAVQRIANDEGLSCSQLVQRLLEMADLKQERCGTCGSVPDAEREAKVSKFNAIRDGLWTMAIHGNLLSSTMAAALIRHFSIDGPNGEDPGEA